MNQLDHVHEWRRVVDNALVRLVEGSGTVDSDIDDLTIVKANIYMQELTIKCAYLQDGLERVMLNGMTEKQAAEYVVKQLIKEEENGFV